MKFFESLFISLTLIFTVGSSSLRAAGKTDAGLILLEVPAARPAALGQAFTAVSNDISAFTYNPATLSSLKMGHASFLYQNGLFDDSSGQLLVGRPFHKGGVGLSIGYYDGGDIVLSDGETQREVTAQRDLSLSLGFAREVGRYSFGVTGKVLTSELAETDHASAYAADFGLGLSLNSRLRLGASIQNIGTKLKFNDQGDDLPQIARVGFFYLLIPSNNNFKTNLLVDLPYYVNQKELRPSFGLETFFGLLAFRIGYRGGDELQEFSIGTGFLLGDTSFDFAFGMVEELDSVQRISLAHRFGVSAQAPEPKLDRKALEPRFEEYLELDKTPTITFPQIPEVPNEEKIKEGKGP